MPEAAVGIGEMKMVKRYKFLVTRYVLQMYSVVTIVNNAVQYI